MLTITIEASKAFNDETSEMVTLDEVVLELEHSLVSLSKWESIWEKPFLGRDEKTTRETISYVQEMTLTPGVSPAVYLRLNDSHLKQINDYISAKMTATWFNEPKSTGPHEVITAEVIYYWMVELNIPFECQYWHLNKLLTLVKVINNKRAPAKKRSASEIAQERAAINARRRAELGTRG